MSYEKPLHLLFSNPLFSPPPLAMTSTLFVAYKPEVNRRRFLEITVDGSRLILRGGVLGLRSKVTVRHCPSEAIAEHELRRLAALSFSQGYEQIV